MKNKLFIAVLAFLSVASVFGANFKADKNINITTPGEGNYYLAGTDVTISIPIMGDVFASGENVFINDSVYGDLMLGAAKIEISNYIAGDARLMGGAIVIGSKIKGDLIVFGGEVRITSEGSVDGDVIIYGGSINMYGPVGGNVIIGGGEISLKNSVQGDVKIKGGEIDFDGQVSGNMEMAAKSIDLGENGYCDGEIVYWSGDGTLDFDNISNNARFDESLAIVEQDRDWSSLVTLFGVGVIMYWIFFILSSLIVILLMEYFFGKYFQEAAALMSGTFVKTFGYGMLFFIGVPVVIFVSFITIIGIPVGLFGLSLYLLALVFTTSITAMMTAHYYKNRANQSWGFIHTVGFSMLALLLYKILFMIPIVGWLIKRVLGAAAFGALILMMLKRTKKPVEKIG